MVDKKLIPTIVEADGSLTPIRLLNKHDNASVKRDKVRLAGGED